MWYIRTTFCPIAVVATAYKGFEGWKLVRWRDEEGAGPVREVESVGLFFALAFLCDIFTLLPFRLMRREKKGSDVQEKKKKFS